MYSVPNNLLSTNNGKTTKGEVLNYKTYILYLAPHTQNSKGINICPHASKGCAKACLYNSGSARYSNVQNGRINKTEYFLSAKAIFMMQLHAELSLIEIKHLSSEFIPVIRLNGTSDIPFEKYLVKDGKNIFELHPNLQFYDYTKNPLRMRKKMPSNYHLTFSMSEDNKEISYDLLHEGYNVAIVFDINKEKELPRKYLGWNVVNGDENDLRFLDQPNSVVGLKYKKLSAKGSDNDVSNNDFIVKL